MADEHALLAKELEDQLVEQRHSLTDITHALLEDPGNEELCRAKEELLEAIQSLEESLLGLKKYQLLSQLENHYQPTSATVSLASDNPAISPPNPGGESCRWGPGHLCQFRHWDGRWHVGKVKEVASLSGTSSHDAEMGATNGGGVATIWFYAPLRQSHVTCRFLEQYGACKFGGSCRMCHGVQAPLDSLHRYKPPDPLRMPLGTKVLACYPHRPPPPLAQGVRGETSGQGGISTKARGDGSSSNVVAGVWTEAEIQAYGGSINSPTSMGADASSPIGPTPGGPWGNGTKFVQVVFLADGHKAVLRCDEVIPLGDGPCAAPQAGLWGGRGQGVGPGDGDSSDSDSASGYESSDERELLSGDEDELLESEGMGLLGAGVGTLVLPVAKGLASATAASADDISNYPGGVAPAGMGLAWHGRLFAGWEAHTRGIGSRLLASMGYVEGKGLGRDSQGIVAPLQVRVLPSRRSLDFCNLSNEAGGPTGAPRKKRRRGGERSRRKKEAALARLSHLPESDERGSAHSHGFGPVSGGLDGGDANVFDVINRRIHKRWSDADEGSTASAVSGVPAGTLAGTASERQQDGNGADASAPGSRGGASSREGWQSKGKPPAGGSRTGASNKLNRAALVGMSDKVEANRNLIQRLVEMEQRNKSDPIVGAAVRQKLEKARKDLAALENAHASVQNEVQKKESQKKWLKF